MHMWSIQFWKDTAERAVRTFAQALAAVLGAGAINILTVDWGQALAVAAGAALLSVLMSVAGSGFGVKGTPSLLPAPKATGEVAVNVDAADVPITARAGFTADVVDADPHPSDIRDMPGDGDA